MIHGLDFFRQPDVEVSDGLDLVNDDVSRCDQTLFVMFARMVNDLQDLVIFFLKSLSYCWPGYLAHDVVLVLFVIGITEPDNELLFRMVEDNQVLVRVGLQAYLSSQFDAR